MNIDDIRLIHRILQELTLISKALHHQDENACNYGLTKRQETRVRNLEKQAEELANKLGLHAFHQSDPRGAALYLVESLKNAYSNYSNGIAIY